MGEVERRKSSGFIDSSINGVSDLCQVRGPVILPSGGRILRVWMMVLLARSEDLSVCGWKVEDMSRLTCSLFMSAVQKLLLKRMSLSEMIEMGSPLKETTASKKRVAVYSAVASWMVGRAKTQPLNLSTTVKMVS